jgi:ribonuclease J
MDRDTRTIALPLWYLPTFYFQKLISKDTRTFFPSMKDPQIKLLLFIIDYCYIQGIDGSIYMVTNIEILDGANVIGGSKILLQSFEENILLDFGLNFKVFSEYFEEYLQPRTSRGLIDLFTLGLLPKLRNFYREDLFPNDMSQELFRYNTEITGIYLSHAHFDHTGCLSYVKSDIPVYTTKITTKILETLQITTKSNLAKDCVSYSVKSACDDGMTLVSNPYIKKKRNFINPDNQDFLIGKLSCKIFPTDHSIYGSSGIALLTDSGWIVYSGDIRIHGERGYLTTEFARSVSKLKPKILIIEGTRVDDDNTITERDVFEKALNVCKNNKGKLIIADFGPRNIDRLISFLMIAKETNRKLLVLTQDLYLLQNLKENIGIYSVDFDLNDIFLYYEPKGARNKWERDLLEEYKNKTITPKDIRNNPGSYILSFSFWDINNLIDIGVRGGIYIYSSSEAYSEEQKIDFERLRNWLRFFDFILIGDPITEKGFHASGHIGRSELFDIIEEISPEFIIPVHTEHPEEFFKKFGSKVILLKNNEKYLLR